MLCIRTLEGTSVPERLRKWDHLSGHFPQGSTPLGVDRGGSTQVGATNGNSTSAGPERLRGLCSL